MMIRECKGQIQRYVSQHNPCPFVLLVVFVDMFAHQLRYFMLVKRQQTNQVHLFNNLQEDDSVVLHDLGVALLE